MKVRPAVGIGVLIFDDQNRVLLGKRIASHGISSWAPPGGHLEFGETFEECAIREVEEETGLKVKKADFYCLTNDIFKQDGKHYISIFMKIDLPYNQSVCNIEPDKIEEWKWFSLNDLPDQLFVSFQNLINNQMYGKV